MARGGMGRRTRLPMPNTLQRRPWAKEYLCPCHPILRSHLLLISFSTAPTTSKRATSSMTSRSSTTSRGCTGACVGVEGRVMPVLPGQTACLRCVFPEPPSPGELATCDTAGVLGAAAAIVAAMQATVAIQILVGATPPNQLVRVDLWRGAYGATSLDDARRHDCPTCGQRRFDFLDAPAGNGSSTSLCGRNAVQVRPAVAGRMDLVMLEHRLTAIGRVQRTAHLLKCDLGSEPGVSLTVFPTVGQLFTASTIRCGPVRSMRSGLVPERA